jgi:hypothetical protein
MMLTAVQNNLYWIGSNYLWEFPDDRPTEQFRRQTESLLKNWLKVPFRIVDHKASIRPANIERRPFVGFHPVYKKSGFKWLGNKRLFIGAVLREPINAHLIWRRNSTLPI